MRFYSASVGLIVLTLAGYVGFGHFLPVAKAAPSGAAQALSDVFQRTQNLRAGVGVRSATHPRRPGIPAVFHISDAPRQAPTQSTFSRSEELGLWSLDGPNGSRFFTDAKKTASAGHYLATAGPVAKIDAEFDAGCFEGIAYRRVTKLATDGSGTESATGEHPLFGRYSLKGGWQKDNFGTWIQRWDHPDGSWETETYQNLPGGTSVLKVASSANVAMSLAFATDLSGNGTVTDCRSGSKGKIEWDSAGDGKVTWTNGAVTEFEDWKI